MRRLGNKVRHRAILALIVLLPACGGEETVSPGYVRDCSAVVFFEPENEATTPSVVGDFNDWTAGIDPLQDTNGDGIYHAVISPPAGMHQYRISHGAETFLDGFNPLTLYDAEGNENSAVLIGDCSVPALEITRFETTPWGKLAAELRFLSADTLAALDFPNLKASLEVVSTSTATIDPSTGDISVEVENIHPGKHRLTVSAADEQGIKAGQVVAPFWIEPEEFAFEDALIYQVVVDRFRKAGGTLEDDNSISFYRGGNLDGVTEAIEEGYFESLGVNTLWLSPLYENPDGQFIGRDGYPAEAYHGYWPAEPCSVEDRFGGAEALDRLVTTAHQHGIRVLMDAVLNHVHEEHAYFTRHSGEGWINHPAGDCICGFSCPWGEYIEECWFDPFLPDLCFANADLVEQVVQDTLWWIDRFDLDGLRIDAVPMMPRLAIRHLRAGLDRMFQGNTHVYLLGETYTARGGQAQIRYYLGSHSLSGQFDFPAMWALRDALAGRIPMTELEAEVEASHLAWEGSGAVMAPILGNHDVPRFISDVNDDEIWQPRESPPPAPDRDKPYDLLKIAWTFLLSQPGAPVIYYGDEYGMPGATDPDNRRNMRFEAKLSERERQVFEHVKILGRARACSKALRRGEMVTLLAHDNLYVFGRDAGDGFPVLVVLNRATVARELEITLPADWQLDHEAGFADLLGAEVTLQDRVIEMTIEPRASALVLSRAECLDF